MIRKLICALAALCLVQGAAIARAPSSTIVTKITQPVAAGSGAVTVAVFMGQSNMNAEGTMAQNMTNGATTSNASSPLPGVASLNAACTGYITTNAPSYTSASSGTITCNPGTVTGTIYPGQVVGYSGSDGTRYVSASNGSGNAPGVTGTGADGTYAISAGSGNVAVGLAGAPVALTFTFHDIGGLAINGGSGSQMPCQIWVPNNYGTPSNGGSFQPISPRANTGDISGSSMYGSEEEFCARWSADNPGKTLYIIKASKGASTLCPVASGNNISPEATTSTGLSGQAYTYAMQELPFIRSALGSIVDTNGNPVGYQIKYFVYTQGEQDAKADVCSFPSPPFSNSVNTAIYNASAPNTYQQNMLDLIGHWSIAADTSASFTGSISGTVLTVSSVTSGTVRQYQALSGANVLTGTYIGTQISGTPGGAGTYNLVVYQSMVNGNKKVTVTDSTSGASTACGQWSGTWFLADSPGTAQTYSAACATAAFAVGDTISATGLYNGTVITASYLASGAKDGLYSINVPQSVPSEPMTAFVGGWGTGADTASAIITRTAGQFCNTIWPNSSTTPNCSTSYPTSGVGLGQMALNSADGPALAPALNTRVVQVDDRLWVTYNNNTIHYLGQYHNEIGRRIYAAALGSCDYHTPTC